MKNGFSGAKLDMGRLVRWWFRPGLQQRDGKEGQLIHEVYFGGMPGVFTDWDVKK